MIAPIQAAAPAVRPCDEAMGRLKSRRVEPVMFADWDRVLFINFEVDKDALQREVPFALDLFDGRALVSLVAFTVTEMRPRFGGWAGAALFRPLQIRELFNVRTYVRCQRETGIYLLAEWLGSRVNLRLGPRFYGLPYRLGRLRYEHEHPTGQASGEIRDCRLAKRVAYRAEFAGPFVPSPAGSLDEFLVERYTCFTEIARRRRFFRIWHPPWPQSRAQVIEIDKELLTVNWPCLGDAKLVSANYSPGLSQVWLGRPHRLIPHIRSAFLQGP